MINPYYFTDSNSKIGFKIILESHKFNHATSILSFTPNYTDKGIETRSISKGLKKTPTTCARLMNQCKFKYHILFSARFYKNKEEYQKSDEIERFNNSNINQRLTENDVNDIDVKSQLEHQIQIQETKESAWTFDKKKSMKLGLYKTGGLNGSNYVKNLLSSNVLVNIKIDDNFS